VCDALRVLTAVDIGYAQVLSRPVGWADGWTYNLPALTEVATLRRYPDKFDNYGWLQKPNLIPREALNQLTDIFGGCVARSPTFASRLVGYHLLPYATQTTTEPWMPVSGSRLCLARDATNCHIA